MVHPGGRSLRALSAAGAALALLALLAVLLLAGRRDDEGDGSRAAEPVQRSIPREVHGHASGVGLPELLPGDQPVRPVRVLLVWGPTFTPTERRREGRALRRWLVVHHNPRTRLRILHGSRRIAPRLRGRFSFGAGRRLLVLAGVEGRRVPPGVAVLLVRAVPGAHLVASVDVRPGGVTDAAVDPTVRGEVAATAARAVISLTGLRERRDPSALQPHAEPTVVPAPGAHRP